MCDREDELRADRGGGHERNVITFACVHQFLWWFEVAGDDDASGACSHDGLDGQKSLRLGGRLEEVDLSSANMDATNLSNASLDGAFIQHSRMTRANLSGASFKESNLRFSKVKGARLAKANMQGANLEGAF